MLIQATQSKAPVAAAQPTKLFIEDQIGFVELLETFGNDLTVVNAARVSFHKESYEMSERDAKLINYLADHKHITPFFHPQLRFRLKMPIYVARQWFKHTVGFVRNEVSRRYVDEDPQFFTPQLLRQRDKNIKQGSSSEAIENNDTVTLEMKNYFQKSLEYYNQLLEIGVCPEQARGTLPQAMYTEFIETASLSAYARLVDLRTEAGAQREIRDYAQLISQCIEPVFPVSWKALIKKINHEK